MGVIRLNLWLAGSLAGCLVVIPAKAQDPNSAKANPAPASPSVPSAKAGMVFFRQLLSATPSQRQQLLTNRPPQDRIVLTNALRVYDGLSAEQRELRLRTLELRFQVSTLLRTAQSNRVNLLKSVPEADRSAVEERLKYWDQWPPDLQKLVLENERLRRVIEVVSPATPPSAITPPGLKINADAQVAAAAARWQALSEEKRAQVEDIFNRVFELSDAEKAAKKLEALRRLNPAELEQMQQALDQFKTLSREQRDLCIRSFKKFADFSPPQRLQFLKSAEEWQKMSPADRQSWRILVKRVPQFPPLPPGLGQPPMPPLLRSLPKPNAYATN